MQFLLVAINAKYIHSNPALYSLQAYAGARLRPYVQIAEYTINQRMQYILADIYVKKPAAVGFSCYIWNWDIVRELIVELKKLLPGTDIWLGGPEVSYDASQIMQEFPGLTGIMIGEGEETFRELLGWYVRFWGIKGKPIKKEKQSELGELPMDEAACVSRAEKVGKQDVWGQEELRQIAGLCLSTGFTAPRQLTDLSKIPFLYESLTESLTEGLTESLPESLTKSPTGSLTESLTEGSAKSLTVGLNRGANPCLVKDVDVEGNENIDKNVDGALRTFTHKIIYYESSRGCPYRCSYCLSSIDKKVRLRDLEIVKKELQFFLDRKVKQVKFVDRTFNCNHEHAMGIWQYIYEHDNGVTNFHFEISADILREDELALLAKFRPGLAQLEIGVQSVNPQTIQAIDRVMDVEKLERVVAAIRRGRNIHQHLDLIAGLPYEDYDSFVNSFNRVYGMRPDQLQLGFLKVLKGSPMEERAEKYGLVALSRPPYEVLYTNWISYEEILRLKRVEEMVEIYYNSGQFTAAISFLEQAFDDPFQLYDSLADYYEGKGYFTENPSRSYRYQVLLDFAAVHDGEFVDCYRELLTYDLYLRENMKSRLDFARKMYGQETVKAYIREFYQREEKERVYLPGYEAYDWKQMSKMTHLEPFSYPVWDAGQMQELRTRRNQLIGGQGSDSSHSQPSIGCQQAAVRYVLFDYRKRDPLNYQASIQVIEMHTCNWN